MSENVKGFFRKKNLYLVSQSASSIASVFIGYTNRPCPHASTSRSPYYHDHNDT